MVMKIDINNKYNTIHLNNIKFIFKLYNILNIIISNVLICECQFNRCHFEIVTILLYIDCDW